MTGPPHRVPISHISEAYQLLLTQKSPEFPPEFSLGSHPFCSTHPVSPQEPQDLEITWQAMLFLSETIPCVPIGLSTLALQPALYTSQPTPCLPALCLLAPYLPLSFDYPKIRSQALAYCHELVLFKAGMTPLSCVLQIGAVFSESSRVFQIDHMTI